MASLDSLDALLHEELKDMYDAEKQLTKALPKMIKKASAKELKAAFDEHLRQTEQHVERLEQAFEHLGVPARGKKCEGMKNLLKEGEGMIDEAEGEATRDAVMIASAQKVEHYEIASYGTARTWATVLGKSEIAALLEETLEEEKETDQKLTEIAEAFVNEAAAEGDEDAEEEEEETVRGRGGRGTRTASRASQPAADDRGRTGARKR
jgi:ferritin-like metal-binding protein YciE